MNPLQNLVLPQNDTPANRQARAAALVEQQKSYQYDYPAIVDGLPMAAAPIPVEVSVLWLAGVVELALALGENLLNIVAPNLVSLDPRFAITLGSSGATVPAPSPAAALASATRTAPTEVPKELREVQSLRSFLEDTRARLDQHKVKAPPPPPAGAGDAQLFAPSPAASIAFADVEGWLRDIFRKLADFIGSLLGIHGRASDVQAYTEQFRTLPLPWPAGVWSTDEVFAQLRVAGSNPIMIRRATREQIPVNADEFQTITGRSLDEALRAHAVYVADYADLASLVPGTLPEPKFVFAPRALFFVGDDGSLRPLAIQIGQAADSPVFLPGGGTQWEIAKIIVNMADGNQHELVSHLGLTHLLTEPFVLATYRQLDPEHPLYALLAPHFAGTLLINYAAQTALIVDGGAVDQLLTGTIQSSRLLSANAVKAVRYNASFFPDTLAQRGVADRGALPDYPYRDDALRLWNAIHAWVSEYVGIFYRTPDDISGDYELQAWIGELVSAGHLQDIGENEPGATPRIVSAGYLARLLTQVIFTASVQHAAVNFPQRTIMAYTPVMPLAACADFPAPPGAPATQILDVLPPLQMGLLQQLVGTGLGGVQYTTLGAYAGELPWFQVNPALRRFQQRLQKIEEAINAENHLGSRTAYTTLLPSLIPQSINI